MLQEGLNNILKSIVSEITNKTDIQNSHTLVEDLGMDEVAIVELGVEVERVFGIEIPNINDGSFKTVDDVLNVIIQKIGE